VVDFLPLRAPCHGPCLCLACFESQQHIFPMVFAVRFEFVFSGFVDSKGLAEFVSTIFAFFADPAGAELLGVSGVRRYDRAHTTRHKRRDVCATQGAGLALWGRWQSDAKCPLRSVVRRRLLGHPEAFGSTVR